MKKKIATQIGLLQSERGGRFCFPMLMGGTSITAQTIDDVYEDLCAKCKDCDGSLDVLVDSGGGDIDAAYNLAMAFRRFGVKQLNFIVPRWAKSAATLLVCSGDCIYMTPIAELGPLDPQITEFNPLEKRLEKYSPLHVKSTLELIRKEYQEGSEKLADKLTERLQFPMTLGGIQKSFDISKQYLVKLLETRMLRGKKPEEISTIAEKLTTGYADHGFCINIDEAKNIGLQISEVEGKEIEIVFAIHKLAKERQRLEQKMRENKLSDILDKLPPGIAENLQTPVKK